MNSSQNSFNRLNPFVKETPLGDSMVCYNVVREVIEELHFLLPCATSENENTFKEMRQLEKLMLVRAFGADVLSNPLEGIKKSRDSGLVTPPLVGIFLGDHIKDTNGEKSRLIITPGYASGLGESDIDRLRSHIINDTALEEYYEPESAVLAREFINAKLEQNSNQYYKGLKLITKEGRTLSWNSIGHDLGEVTNLGGTISYQTRIGANITNGGFDKGLPEGGEKDNGININTAIIVDEYIAKVSLLLNNGKGNDSNLDLKGNDSNLDLKELIDKLSVFKLLSRSFDFTWNEGQFIMNMSVSGLQNGAIAGENPGVPQDKLTSTIFNPLYPLTLGYSREEILNMIMSGTLISTVYKGYDDLVISLMKQGNYCMDFNGIPWVRRNETDNFTQSNLTVGIATNFKPVEEKVVEFK